MIEISDWETPFNKGDLHIVSVSWGIPNWSVQYANGDRFEYGNANHCVKAELVIKVFHKESASIYEIKFESVGGFRVLDERGFIYLWDSGKVKSNCFMVKGLAWSDESPLSYHSHTDDGWSYFISTSDDCAEIITTSKPVISVLQSIKPVACK